MSRRLIIGLAPISFAIPAAGLALALVAAGTGLAIAQPAPAPSATQPVINKADLPGRQIFDHQCAPCHGAGPGDDGAPMLPATALLTRKYEGNKPGALELRTDLDAEVLRYFVRNGSGGMPMFRKSELTDAQVDAVAAYLAATARASGG